MRLLVYHPAGIHDPFETTEYVQYALSLSKMVTMYFLFTISFLIVVTNSACVGAAVAGEPPSCRSTNPGVRLLPRTPLERLLTLAMPPCSPSPCSLPLTVRTMRPSPTAQPSAWAPASARARLGRPSMASGRRPRQTARQTLAGGRAGGGVSQRMATYPLKMRSHRTGRSGGRPGGTASGPPRTATPPAGGAWAAAVVMAGGEEAVAAAAVAAAARDNGGIQAGCPRRCRRHAPMMTGWV